jgi:glycosyltransferase involved in cell wall biosynthesis
MKISINILTWNCFSTLHDTLHILSNDLARIPHELIVVDNGSTDGSEKFATIANKENRGVSIGKNQGIKASKGEYILLLDGDIVPVPNSVNLLIEWLDSHPEEHAIGFYPNKFTDQRNKNGQKHHEECCNVLHEPRIHTQVIAFYGLFRRKMFDEGLLFPEYHPFDGPGYGWEDSDLYMQMCEKGIRQWVAGINNNNGKYYHEINSSIRQMGHGKYVNSSKERGAAFINHWSEERVREIYK